MNSKRAVCLVAWLPLLAQSCFYDSRWGEAKRVQQHNVATLTPAELPRAPESSPQMPRRSVPVRVLATSKYVAQTFDWQRDTRSWIADASAVLEGALGLRLQIVAMNSWSLSPEQEDVERALQALKAQAPSTQDEGWTVGLIGGLPRYTVSFHQLGMAPLNGTSFVLRAGSDLTEQDAIERGFDEIPVDERMELARKRRRHRAVAVFLHELGHTLGAVHHQDERGWMFAQYNTSMVGYGPVVTELLRTSLRHRTEPTSREGVRTWAHEMLTAYQKPSSDTWIASERETQVRWLSGVLAAANGAAPHASADGGDAGSELVGVAAADQGRYRQAHDMFQAGRVAEAQQALAPLSEQYPNVLEVQDLRCQIAMRLGSDMPTLRAACARLMELSKASKK